MDSHQTLKIKAPEGRVIVKIDTKQKERYALENGATLHISRGYNFNLREDKASSGYVIDSEKIPSGSYVLTNYLATEPTYEIPYQSDFLTEEEMVHGWKIFSIPHDMVFCYQQNGEWIPCEEFILTKRVFKPYTGNLVGVEPEVVKNRMYVTKGKGEGKVVLSELNCDYEIVFHNTENREERVLRTWKREIIGVDNKMTSDLKKGKYLVGLSSSTAKKL